MSRQRKPSDGHVFISYVREDAKSVDRLAEALNARGATIWLDRSEISPGEDWREAIRKAIERGAYFVACFSANYAARGRTHMNEELAIAMDELLRRPRDRAWFLPVLLDPDTVPDWRIDAARTLGSFQQVWLYDDWDNGIKRLLDVISPTGSRQINRTSTNDASQLALPISATYSGMQKLSEAVIDATLYAASALDPRENIRKILNTGSPLPTSLPYTTPSGGRNWIRLCEDPLFRSHHEAVNFWSSPQGRNVGHVVIEQLGQLEFDYISLGCGDGIKDGRLLRHWLRADADLTYYPYDINLDLLQTAVRRGLGQLPENTRERLQVKAVQSDFSTLNNMALVFAQHSSPNVISLLGNNLAALDDELNLLAAIHKRMSKEDLLILEARLAPENSSEPDFTSRAALDFYLGPLRDLGLQVDSTQIAITAEKDQSRIEATTTQLIRYGSLTLNATTFRDVCIARIHSYMPDALLRALQRIGLEVIHSQVNDHRGAPSLVCVARRAADKPAR